MLFWKERANEFIYTLHFFLEQEDNHYENPIMTWGNQDQPQI